MPLNMSMGLRFAVFGRKGAPLRCIAKYRYVELQSVAPILRLPVR